MHTKRSRITANYEIIIHINIILPFTIMRWKQLVTHYGKNRVYREIFSRRTLVAEGQRKLNSQRLHDKFCSLIKPRRGGYVGPKND
jgi:hypothetical protein